MGCFIILLAITSAGSLAVLMRSMDQQECASGTKGLTRREDRRPYGRVMEFGRSNAIAVVLLVADVLITLAFTVCRLQIFQAVVMRNGRRRGGFGGVSIARRGVTIDGTEGICLAKVTVVVGIVRCHYC